MRKEEEIPSKLEMVGVVEEALVSPKVLEVHSPDVSNQEKGNIVPDETVTFQYFLELVGTKGPWNYLVFFLCAMCTFVSPLQSLSYQFLGATPSHWCHIPELVDANWTDDQILQFAIPYDNATEDHDECRMYNLNYSTAAELGYEESLNQLDALTIDEEKINCAARDYNFTDFQSTVVTEWDLVCNRRFLYSTTFSASFFVRLFTSPFIGFFIDAIGRRMSILISTALFIPSCLLAAVSPNYIMYLILRVLIAQFDSCFYMATFVLCLELSGKSQRSMLGVLFCVPWSLGYMALPGIAYLIRDWRYLQVALTMPSVFMISYFWLLPESPRWLVLKGRHEEALKILKSAAKMNKYPPLKEEDILKKMKEMESEELNEDTGSGCYQGLLNHAKAFGTHFCKLFKSWPLLRLTIVVMFCWFSSSATYYGVSLNGVNLSTDIYLYMFFGGLLEFPSYVLLWPLVSFLGRKKSFILLFVGCGIAIFIIPVLDEFAPTAPETVKVASSLCGKMAITMAFQLAYLYTGELYHTSHRSFFISLGAIFSAAGGAVSPYINDLLVEKATWAPSVTFGTISIIAAALCITLPETKDEELPDNVRY
ncbi:organic cation/carnitine transporter 2-like isoform X2 [Palaemon carinicauda]